MDIMMAVFIAAVPATCEEDILPNAHNHPEHWHLGLPTSQVLGHRMVPTYLSTTQEVWAMGLSWFWHPPNAPADSVSQRVTVH